MIRSLSIFAILVSIGCTHAPTDAELRAQAFRNAAQSFLTSAENSIKLERRNPTPLSLQNLSRRTQDDCERMPDARHNVNLKHAITRMKVLASRFDTMSETLRLAIDFADAGKVGESRSMHSMLDDEFSKADEDIAFIKECIVTK